MTEQHVRTWTEAPASANIKFNLGGFDIMLTLRGDSGADLLPKVEAALEWLSKKGATPTTGRTENGNGNKGDKPDVKICPVHHTPMKLRQGKGGDQWYSHKAVNPDTGKEYWCRGEQK